MPVFSTLGSKHANSLWYRESVGGLFFLLDPLLLPWRAAIASLLEMLQEIMHVLIVSWLVLWPSDYHLSWWLFSESLAGLQSWSDWKVGGDIGRWSDVTRDECSGWAWRRTGPSPLLRPPNNGVAVLKEILDDEECDRCIETVQEMFHSSSVSS